MGRKKLEMKRIEDKSSRQVTFTKRRGGLIKKARELSILCDVDVALLIFSARGKPFEFSSSPSITQIIQRYDSHHEAEEMTPDNSKAESRFAGFLTRSELLEIIERQLDEPAVNQISTDDLILLENQIDDALFQIRSKKTQLMLDSISDLHEKEKMLIEENKHLANELDEMEGDRNRSGDVDTYSPRLALHWL